MNPSTTALRFRWWPALAAVLSCCAASAQQTLPEAGRGALLYETHCVACHTEQMHWRTLRRARDWDSLRAQVTRWQGEARLNWSREDIDAVARHLNDTIYQFPVPDSQARPGAPPADLRRSASSR